jgi:parvulin-like peptidyl-prolyl isomerase
MLSFLRKKMKSIMITVAVIFAATMFYGLGYRGIKTIDVPNKDSIATINGKEVDHNKLANALKNVFSQQKGRVKPEQAVMYQVVTLQQLIDRTLMVSAAKKKFGVSGAEMDATINQVMQSNKIPNTDTLRNMIESSGQKYSDFKETIKEEILLSKMMNQIRSSVVITPEDLREVRARHILIVARGTDAKADFEARSRMEQIIKKIKQGENFSTLAIQNSDDRGSGEKGGDLGYFSTGTMVPDFEKVAFSLKPGQMSDVFKTQYGYHVVLVDDTRLIKPKEKGKDISEQVLAQKQDQAVQKWAMSLREAAKIEINDPLMKAHTYLMSNKLNEAVTAYNDSLMRNPSNPYVHLFLADTYVLLGNKEFAFAELEKAAQYAGGDTNLLMAIGDAMVKLKKTTQGVELYKKASLVSGDDKAIHTELKEIFQKLGYSADAANEANEIRRIEKKEKFEKEIQDKMK